MRRHDCIYPKLAIIGHARHGKDTVAEILRDQYGFEFMSSSLFCAEEVIFPVTQVEATRIAFGFPEYPDAFTCFSDRARHRSSWFDLIAAFNKHDPARLGRAIFAEHDIYVGIRAKRELWALKTEGTIDLTVWVDRTDHLAKEPSSSMTLEPWMADFHIDNNGSFDDLKNAVYDFAHHRLTLQPRGTVPFGYRAPLK